jgi:hypothetical protein
LIGTEAITYLSIFSQQLSEVVVQGLVQARDLAQGLVLAQGEIRHLCILDLDTNHLPDSYGASSDPPSHNASPLQTVDK